MANEHVRFLPLYTPHLGSPTNDHGAVTPSTQTATISDKNEELQKAFREWRRAWDRYYLRVEEYFTAVTHRQESFATRSRHCNDGLYQDLTNTIEQLRQAVLEAEGTAYEASRLYEAAKTALRDAEDGSEVRDGRVPRRMAGGVTVSAVVSGSEA